jgi:hypothetical protein
MPLGKSIVREKVGDLAPTEEAQDLFGRALHCLLSYRVTLVSKTAANFVIQIKITSQR